MHATRTPFSGGASRVDHPGVDRFDQHKGFLGTNPTGELMTSELPRHQEESPSDSNWGRRLMIPKYYF
jgi:hypothetical protein